MFWDLESGTWDLGIAIRFGIRDLGLGSEDLGLGFWYLDSSWPTDLFDQFGVAQLSKIFIIKKLCMAHASTHGARKPPGPKYCIPLTFARYFQHKEIPHESHIILVHLIVWFLDFLSFFTHVEALEANSTINGPVSRNDKMYANFLPKNLGEPLSWDRGTELIV